MRDYEIVPYSPELMEPMIALYTEAFPRTPQACRDYLEWKYWRNPYLDESLLFFARDARGAIVGMRGFYGTCWEIAGQRVVIPCADDFAITAGERNKGLMTIIMRTALDALARRGFAYTLNASGGQLTVLQSLAMGWKSLGPMEPVARMTGLERVRRRIDRAAQRTLFRLFPSKGWYSSSSFAELDRRGKAAKTREGNVAVESAPRVEAMAELIASIARDGRIRHVRDADFLRWRFGNPTREYRFLYYERGGALEGFLALAAYPRSSLAFKIVDVEAKSESALAALLEAACAWGRFPSVATWSASHSPAAKDLLTRHGFVPIEVSLRARGMPCVLIKTIGASTGQPAIDGAAWDIRLIDSMQG
jgi:GNAT superfamily N-acetyltransferase